jgi:hypothetical protein
LFVLPVVQLQICLCLGLFVVTACLRLGGQAEQTLLEQPTVSHAVLHVVVNMRGGGWSNEQRAATPKLCTCY